ncbi:MAG: tryptophan synthase subunit alpha [Planctomycetota bacterium]
MSAIPELFTKLRSENRKALMPFVTAGDPDLDFTAAVLKEVVSRGASLCEIGIPYSDPIADGPVIQASYTRALENKIKLSSILEMLGDTCPGLGAPAVTMVSYAIIYRHGIERYCDDVKARGVAGLIVPDLPVEESPTLAKVCGERDLSLIQLVTPTTPRDRG